MVNNMLKSLSNSIMKVFIDEDNELDEVDSEYVAEMVDDTSIEQLGITLSKNIF